MDPNQLENQLRGIGDDRAVAIIAARAALRLVPAMRLWDFDSPQLQRYLLSLFRCMAHVWAKARYKGSFERRSDIVWHNLDLICSEIEPIESIKKESKAVFFAVSQAGKAFAGLNILADAKAVILASLRTGDRFQLALDDDLGHLKLEGVDKLAECLLWPDFLSKELPAAEKYVPDLWGEDHPDWQVWLDLYNRYIVEGADGEELFQQIAIQGETFWERTPEKVNIDIASLMRRFGKHSISATVELQGVSAKLEVGNVTATVVNRHVEAQQDRPALEDFLGRSAFASVLALRLDKLACNERTACKNQEQEAGQSQGYAILLHAPWGKGKTSLWNLLRQRLSDFPLSQKFEVVPPAGCWITATFNAWEYEHRKKPWMPFLETVKDACQDVLHKKRDYPRCEFVGDAWRSWRIGNSPIPWALLLVFGVALALVGFALSWPEIQNWLGITPVPTLWANFERMLGFTPASPESLGTFLGVIATLGIGGIAAWEVFRRFGRSTAHGGEIAADYYDELKSDPLKKLRKLFRDVTRISNRPIDNVQYLSHICF